MTQDPEQIHQGFAAAFNRHDADAVAALYEPDALLVGHHREVRGTAAIREVYRAIFARRPAIELRTLGAFQAGGLALLFGKWILRETAAGGAVTEREGYNTETVRRQPDGRWLFVIDQPYSPR
jgi:uncharacterized protein (TIGR02246 family)